MQNCRSRKVRGTMNMALILVITVIAGLYFGIKYGYKEYQLKSNRSNVISYLQEDVQQMNDFYNQHGTYALGDNWPNISKTKLTDSGELVLYTIEFDPPRPGFGKILGYSLVARVNPNSEQAVDGNVCINQDGKVIIIKEDECPEP